MNPEDGPALRMRSIVRLARPTAHEVRGVLSAIRLHLELLSSTLERSEDEATTQRQRRYLTVLDEECRRLERVTGVFLDLLAPPGGAGETDLAALIASVVEAARPLAVERRVTLETALSGPVARRLEEPEGARQRVLDVVLDALTAAQRGSTVRVDLEGERATVTIDGSMAAQVSLLDREDRADA